MAVFLDTYPIFLESEQKIWYPLIRKQPNNLVHILFGQAWHQMDHHGKYLAETANFRQNLAVLGQKSNLGHPMPSSQNPEYFGREDFFVVG